MENFVTKEEFKKLESEVKTMSHNVNTLSNSVSAHVKIIEVYMKKMDAYQDRLLDVVTKTSPQGHMPLDSHYKIVKSLIWSFTVVILVTVSAVKLIPVMIDKL